MNTTSRTIYNIENDQRELVAIEVHDEHDRLVERVDHHKGEPFLTTSYYFNDSGQIESTREVIQNEEPVITTYEYEDGEVCLIKKLNGNEIAYEERTIRSEGVVDVIRLTQGQISERVRREERPPNGFIRSFFDEDDEMVERHLFTLKGSRSELLIEDENGDKAALELCEYDGAGRVLQKTVHNSVNAIIYMESILYSDSGEILRVDAFDASAEAMYTISEVEYDDEGRFVENEVTDLYGTTLEFVKRTYDAKGEISEEIYFKPFHGDVARQIGDGEAYHLVME